jgi:hypothetical protein
MRKASIRLQELRRKIYSKAKTEKHWKFWGLYCHLCKKEVLEQAETSFPSGDRPGHERDIAWADASGRR